MNREIAKKVKFGKMYGMTNIHTDKMITKWHDEREYDRIIASINERIQYGFTKHRGSSQAVYEEIIERLSVAIFDAHIIGNVISVKTLAIQLAHVYHLFMESKSIAPFLEVIYE